jgi:CRISPR/Cas system endoribonuclease Cas6 (RAMP superfamily)
VVFFDDMVEMQYTETLTDISELSNVAWPTVVQQAIQCTFTQFGPREAMFILELQHEMLNQKVDIMHTLAQGRDFKRHDV